MMVLCVGPEGSGKTLLLKRIISKGKNIDTKTIPTVGVNITTLQQEEQSAIHVRELGGSMAPIWHSYCRGIQKVIYVIDAVNMMQVGAAALNFLNLITHPQLKCLEIAIVWNKIDCPAPRTIKELTGLMRLDEIKQEAAHKNFTIFEVSAMANKGIKPLLKWITEETPVTKC